MTLLDVRNLTVRFPSSSGEVFAVRDVSFAIAPGEVLGLVGESGSGKSVTSLAAMGLLVPQARASGEILFEGRDVLRASGDELRKLRGSRMAMIFQEPMTALNPVMRVGDQVAEAARAHGGVTRQEACRRAVEALNAVAIPDPDRRARDYPHQMSGGQRQRVMIAMALVNKPSLLIADEPTTALDVTVQAQILELMADLRRRFGLAMLFISHDLSVVSQVSDRIAVMFGGRIVETGPARQVFHNPQHPYTKGLLESVPTLKTSRAKPLGTVEKSAKVNDGELVEVGAGHWVRRVQK